MPKNGIDADLKGIEAAAFRIEDPGYRLCGMGGKAEQCMKSERCMLDVYIDERKYPLPWAYPEQKADWNRMVYNSARWLRTAAGGKRLATPELIPSSLLSDGIFADPDGHKEAMYFKLSDDDDPTPWESKISIFGFKRNVISGLTLIAFDFGCDVNNKLNSIKIRLVSRPEVSGSLLPKKPFHEMIIPYPFKMHIQEALKNTKEENAQYFRNLLQQK